MQRVLRRQEDLLDRNGAVAVDVSPVAERGNSVAEGEVYEENQVADRYHALAAAIPRAAGCWTSVQRVLHRQKDLLDRNGAVTVDISLVAERGNSVAEGEVYEESQVVDRDHALAAAIPRATALRC